MAQLERSWQYCHSCIVESVWKTLLSLCVNNDNVAFSGFPVEKDQEAKWFLPVEKDQEAKWFLPVEKDQKANWFALMKCDLWYYYMFKHKWIFYC